MYDIREFTESCRLKWNPELTIAQNAENLGITKIKARNMVGSHKLKYKPHLGESLASDFIKPPKQIRIRRPCLGKLCRGKLRMIIKGQRICIECKDAIKNIAEY